MSVLMGNTGRGSYRDTEEARDLAWSLGRRRKNETEWSALDSFFPKL